MKNKWMEAIRNTDAQVVQDGGKIGDRIVASSLLIHDWGGHVLLRLTTVSSLTDSVMAGFGVARIANYFGAEAIKGGLIGIGTFVVSEAAKKIVDKTPDLKARGIRFAVTGLAAGIGFDGLIASGFGGIVPGGWQDHGSLYAIVEGTTIGAVSEVSRATKNSLTRLGHAQLEAISGEEIKNR